MRHLCWGFFFFKNYQVIEQRSKGKDFQGEGTAHSKANLRMGLGWYVQGLGVLAESEETKTEKGVGTD